jgi:uncharacterized protein (DUF58 family)
MRADPPASGRPVVLHGAAAGETLWLAERRGLALMLAVLALAVWAGAPVVALAAGLFAALGLVARGWSRLCLGVLRCTARFEADRAFPDDELDLVLEIENRWPVPIPWLETELVVPHRLYPLDGPVRRDSVSEARVIRTLGTLLPFQRSSRRYRLRCRARGLYVVGTVGLLVADPLRLFPRRGEYPVDARLVVYPTVLALDQLGLRSALPRGDANLRRVLYDDPLRPIGVRDYRPGDSPRQIHWKASARRPRLQTKILERTVQLQVALYLDVDGFDHPWVVYRDALFERAVTAAATLANAVVERGGRAALATSGDEPAQVLAAGGAEHLMLILERLAVVEPGRGRPLASILAATVPRQPTGTTIAVAVPTLTPEVADELRAARRRGHPVALVHAGLDRVAPPDGVDLYELGGDRDVARALS